VNALFQGVFMGLAIAAPVGPIGMLCIRRALQGGACIGLASGLGASTADALYGFAVASGFALTGWLMRHSIALSVIGASLLIWMGLGALRAFLRIKSSNGAPVESPPADRISRRAAFGSTFALTVSNPATLVGFVGVIGTLGAAGTNSGTAFLLVMGVFLGSMLWWTTLVIMVRSARAILSVSLRWIDLATGVVLVTTGSWIVATTLIRTYTECANQ
jgi:threonine/homoserine/homoserine lactone efflux protein